VSTALAFEHRPEYSHRLSHIWFAHERQLSRAWMLVPPHRSASLRATLAGSSISGPQSLLGLCVIVARNPDRAHCHTWHQGLMFQPTAKVNVALLIQKGSPSVFTACAPAVPSIAVCDTGIGVPVGQDGRATAGAQ